MKRNVYIRADGNSQIGLGHLVRCIALSHMLKEHYTVYFVSKSVPTSIVQEIEAADFSFISIESENDFLTKLEFEDFVVLDHYDLDSTYQKAIKKIGCILVCIDDIHDKEFFADLIINHAPGVQTSDYHAQDYTQFALGLDFVLLRPSFLEAAKQARTIEKVDSVFICFGGSDSKNLTSKVLNIVTQRKYFDKIIVVIGSAFEHLEILKKIIHTDERVQIESSVNADRMLRLMSISDLAIVPSSGILLEALSAKCRLVSGYYAANQLNMYSYYSKLNFFADAKDFRKESLEKAIDLAVNKSSDSLFCIDGHSKHNIIEKFNNLDFHLREVSEMDLELLFNWANDPDVRRNAFSTEQIEWGDHVNWFRNRLKDDRTKMLILERGATLIGQVRFENEDGYWKVDYSISKNFRGLGMGYKIIKLALEEIEGPIKALVKRDNKASCKIFEKLGFTKDYVLEEDFNHYILIR